MTSQEAEKLVTVCEEDVIHNGLNLSRNLIEIAEAEGVDVWIVPLLKHLYALETRLTALENQQKTKEITP